MKSRITIEVDFGNNNVPVIQILFRPSDDVRDSLLQSFLQSFHGSSLCKINWRGQELGEDGFQRVFIWPISKYSIPEEKDLPESISTFLEYGEIRGSSNGIGEQKVG